MVLFDKQVPILNKYIDERTGYLHIKARVSRSGIQDYLGMELGVDGLDPYATYKVYRPKEEVIKEDSLKTLINAPVTNEHPTDFVNKDNSNELAKGVGVTYNVVEDGNISIVESDLIVQDKDLIKEIENGKNEISLGYEQNLIKEEGEFEGEKYQFKQTDIKINHIALVDKGRCGDKCKILTDSNVNIIEYKTNERITMPKSIIVDGISHEVTDCVAKHIASLNTKIADMETKVEKLDEELEVAEAKMDAMEEENKGLKDSLAKSPTTDSMINDAINAKLKLIDTAKKLSLDCKVVDSNESIKKAIIGKQYPKLSLDGKSEVYINALVDSIEEILEDEEENKQKADESEKKATDGFKQKDGAINDADVAKRIADKKASAFQMPKR